MPVSGYLEVSTINNAIDIKMVVNFNLRFAKHLLITGYKFKFSLRLVNGIARTYLITQMRFFFLFTVDIFSAPYNGWDGSDMWSPLNL